MLCLCSSSQDTTKKRWNKDQNVISLVPYIVTMHKFKMKLENNFIYNSIKNNYLGINLTEEVQNTYSDNYKQCLKTF